MLRCHENDELALLALDEVLDEFSLLIYWKDVEGVYLGANETCRRVVKKTTGNTKIIGLTDYEIFAPKIAKQFRDDDDEVKTQLKQLFFEEEFTDGHGCKILQTSSKRPIFDDNKQLKGVLGITRRLNMIEFPGYPDVIISYRECQVLCLLCRGMVAKTIGERLHISTRTVETHIANIRSKFFGYKLEQIISEITSTKLLKSLEDVIY